MEHIAVSARPPTIFSLWWRIPLLSLALMAAAVPVFAIDGDVVIAGWAVAEVTAQLVLYGILNCAALPGIALVVRWSEAEVWRVCLRRLSAYQGLDQDAAEETAAG